MTSDVIALTGATGFLGRRLVEQLSSDGKRLRILARTPAAANDWKCRTPHIVTGDLNDQEALSELVDGADSVINVAGLIKARSRAEFFKVNAEGARRVAMACGGRRLIHVSSLAAREPALSDYAASKRAGETAVREVGATRVTIVRPPAIYGPGDRETLAFFKSVGGACVFAPANRKARLTVAHADDVAKIISGLIDDPRSPLMVAIGGDRATGYSWPELIAAAARAVQSRPAIIPVPDWLLILVGAVVEDVGRSRRKNPIFTRGKAREACHPDWSISPFEANLTAAHHFIPLEVGFERTVTWYRAAGWLR